jgi:hypothetical protein
MAANSVDSSRPCEPDVSHSGSPRLGNAAPALDMRSRPWIFFQLDHREVGAECRVRANANKVLRLRPMHQLREQELFDPICAAGDADNLCVLIVARDADHN